MVACPRALDKQKAALRRTQPSQLSEAETYLAFLLFFTACLFTSSRVSKIRPLMTVEVSVFDFATNSPRYFMLPSVFSKDALSSSACDF